MKIGKKYKEWFQSSTPLKKALTLIIAVGLCFGGVLIAQAASAPTAKIVAYADKSSTSLRVAQMLEVQTTNFSDDAKLKYEYDWSDTWSLIPYNVFSSPDTAYYSYAHGDNRYVVVTGTKSTKGKLSVTVKQRKMNG